MNALKNVVNATTINTVITPILNYYCFFLKSLITKDIVVLNYAK